MSHSFTILQIAVPSPLRHHFEYLSPKNCDVKTLIPGVRVKIPFRGKTIVGVLLGHSQQSKIEFAKLKPIVEFIDQQSLLPDTILQLAKFASDYYQHPIGEVIFNCLPSLLRQGRSTESNPIAMKQSEQQYHHDLTLNESQTAAVKAVSNTKGFATFLLDGVTGSGKTEVYLQIIEQILNKKQQALVLVPEIGLTPQIVARFSERFAIPIAVMHSGLNDRERLQAWLATQTGQANIIIGTRSAIFTPLVRPGIIIIDEEHDLSFKQQSGFRYSAKDLAIVRGKLENIPVVLGSATPSLETLHNAFKKKFHYLTLPKRAGNAVPPKFHIINLRNQSLDEGLSSTLLQSIHRHLQQQGQILLFLNRRGFAPTLLCYSCGWLAKCHRCDARLTFHQQRHQLLCHHCGSQEKIPSQCQKCGNKELLPLGIGTERIEKKLAKHFPNINIVRIDRDSTRRKGSMEKMLQDIQEGHHQILIGTQMLTKGHHFPNVTLVAIVDVDSNLFNTDFRASERMGQLLTQVAGRAGRAEKIGEVYLQTHFPEHPLLLQLIQEGYSSFAKSLLEERQATRLPPCSYFAIIRAESVTPQTALEFLEMVAKESQKFLTADIQLLGPVPALMERKAGRYRAQLLFQTKQRKKLQSMFKNLLPHIENLKLARKARWSIDIDPVELY